MPLARMPMSKYGRARGAIAFFAFRDIVMKPVLWGAAGENLDDSAEIIALLA
jgi:hypothetical protein